MPARKPDRTSLILKDSGYGIMRSDWEADANYLMLNYGSNEPWHAHPDFLSINVCALGRPIITNPGAVRYDSYRSRAWYKQTISHNTVWVNGMSQEKSHAAELEHWLTTPHFDFISASHSGYLFLGVKHRRKILFVRSSRAAGQPEYWLISDDLLSSNFTQTTGYFDARWLAHFQPTELDVTPDQRISTTHRDSNLAVIPLDTTGQRLKTDKGWICIPPSNGTTEVDDAPFMQLVREGEPPLLWSVLLYPFKGETQPEISVTPLPISASSSEQKLFQAESIINRAFRISVKGEEHVWFEFDKPGKIHQFGPFRTDGTTGLIVFKGDRLQRLFLLNASLLEKNGASIFRTDTGLNWLDLSILDDRLDIYADKQSRLNIVASGIKAASFNRQTVPFVQSGECVSIQ